MKSPQTIAMLDDRSPSKDFRELASILAAALLRMQKMAELRCSQESGEPGLEVAPETVLSVTNGLLPETLERGKR